MHRDDRASNLMFLLSLPFLATACPGNEEDESTTNNTSVDPTTAGDTEPGTSTSNGGAETSTSQGVVDTGTTEGPVDSSSGSGNTTGDYEYCVNLPPLMGPVSQACIDQVAKTNECYYDGGLSAECIAYYEAYCQLGIEMAVSDYGEPCGMAYEEFYACLSMLTCELLVDDMPDCEEQSTALDMACMAM